MMESAVHWAVLLAVLAVLVHASYCDIRRREVGDADWALIFGMGALLIAGGSAGLPRAAGFMGALSVVLMAADLLWDREQSSAADICLYIGIAASVIGTLVLSGGDRSGLAYASVPAMYLLMNVLYYTGIVRGGADAKAVIALSAVLPCYVSGGTSAAALMFPPSLAILLYASLMTAAMAAVYLIINAARRDLVFPQALMGYRMSVERAEGSFVWPLTREEAGVLTDGTRADDSDDAFERLKSAGADTIWVTPIIPFVVPITAAYCLVLLLGSPLFI